MRYYLLQLDLPLQLLAIAVHGVVVVGVGIAFMRGVPRLLKMAPESITPVPMFYATVVMVFVMLTAFHLSLVWHRQDESVQAFMQMKTGLQHLHQLAEDDLLDKPAMQESIDRFVRLARDREWVRNQNRAADPEVEAALRDMRKAVLKVEGLPAHLRADLVRLVEKIGTARQQLLWAGSHTRDRIAWAAILLLGWLSHLALGAMHFDRPRAGTIALVFAGCASSIAFAALVARENPYTAGVLEPAAFVPF